MRKQALKIVVTLGLFGALCAGAQAQSAGGEMKVHVPFDFEVGRQTLPAGDYRIEIVGRLTDTKIISIKRIGGRGARLVLATPSDSRKAGGAAGLVFDRVGVRYFLSQVWAPSGPVGLKVHGSGTERTVEVAGNADHATVSLAAGR